MQLQHLLEEKVLDSNTVKSNSNRLELALGIYGPTFYALKP